MKTFDEKYMHVKQMVDLYKQHGENSEMDHLAYRTQYFIPFLPNPKKDGKWEFEKINQRLSFPKEAVKVVKGEPERKGVLEVRREALISLMPLEEIRLAKMKLRGKLIHGMGGAHVRETSITIHPIYGLPYIPASSLKGLVRHWALQAFFDGKIPNSEMGLSDEAREIHAIFADLFGEKGELEGIEGEEYGEDSRKGLATFYDLFMTKGELVPDVLTPHFKEYYDGGKTPPHTRQDPIPLPFYTVESTEVEILLSVSKNPLRKKRSSLNPAQLADLLLAWTRTALEELGIGAKTANNYGRFTGFEESKEWKAEWEKRQEEKRKQEEVKRLAEMTEEERIVYQIAQLLPEKEEDKAKSKGEIYQEVIRLKSKAGAKALKEYWKKSGDWITKISKKPKKQEEKVLKIKEILGE